MKQQFNHMWAEVHMQQAKKVRRAGWPAGKVAYHDVENDGVPDELDVNAPDFLRKSMENYERFRRNIRIAQDGVVQPGAYITHADSLEEDWEITE